VLGAVADGQLAPCQITPTNVSISCNVASGTKPCTRGYMVAT
jgi:hypothetical protein